MARPHLPFNELRRRTYEFFARREWVRPPAYAVGVGFYPISCTYGYLFRQHKYGYLRRGHDVRGRLVYRLAPRGAAWLLKHPDPIV